MKTFNFPKTFLAGIAAVGLMLSATAQNSAPQLAYGVPQVLQLVQAKVSDDTIIAYIHNSGNSYGLNADQIIYLRQQGVSDNILTVMLNQPRPASSPAPTAPPDNSYQAQAPAVYTPTPAPTYVQSAPPPSTVYVVPNSQNYYYNTYAQPYYYPYSYFPSISLAFGFGGSSYYHGGYYGGYHGGYYGGGGYHGGYPSGGYHGGGMGGGGWHL
jgi:hypothetical protein